MRKDMGKVLTERPRTGSKNTNIKTHKKYRGPNVDYDKVDENVPTKKIGHKIAARHEHGYDCKGLTDHIKPLKRFLVTNCGRPWDKVFSEMSEAVSFSGMQGNHIRGHVFDYVDTHTFIGDDGEVWVCTGNGSGTASRAKEHSSRYNVAYVHPKTGILTRYPDIKSHRKTYKDPYKSEEMVLDFIWHSNLSSWRKIDGNWFADEYEIDPGEDTILVSQWVGFGVRSDGTKGSLYEMVPVKRNSRRGFDPYKFKGRRSLGKKEIKTIKPENCGNYENFKRINKFIPSKDWKIDKNYLTTK
jgi:hypothetical protein